MSKPNVAAVEAGFMGRLHAQAMAESDIAAFAAMAVTILQSISGSKIKAVYARALATPMPSLGDPSEDAVVSTCERTKDMAGQLYFGWPLHSHSPTGIWARTEAMRAVAVSDAILCSVRSGEIEPAEN
jgi:hypothetical protein